MLIDMGRMVEDVFRQSKTGGRKCNVTWLAARLNCDRRNVYDIFRRPTIDSQLLAQLSIVLEHNFFRDIAEMIEIRINEKSPTCGRAFHFIFPQPFTFSAFPPRFHRPNHRFSALERSRLTY